MLKCYDHLKVRKSCQWYKVYFKAYKEYFWFMQEWITQSSLLKCYDHLKVRKSCQWYKVYLKAYKE